MSSLSPPEMDTINLLMSMGFDRSYSTEAARHVDCSEPNAAELAMEWMEDNPNELSEKKQNDKLAEPLVNMGFSKDEALRGLQANENNIHRAIVWILADKTRNLKRAIEEEQMELQRLNPDVFIKQLPQDREEPLRVQRSTGTHEDEIDKLTTQIVALQDLVVAYQETYINIKKQIAKAKVDAQRRKTEETRQRLHNKARFAKGGSASNPDRSARKTRPRSRTAAAASQEAVPPPPSHSSSGGKLSPRSRMLRNLGLSKAQPGQDRRVKDEFEDSDSSEEPPQPPVPRTVPARKKSKKKTPAAAAAAAAAAVMAGGKPPSHEESPVPPPPRHPKVAAAADDDNKESPVPPPPRALPAGRSGPVPIDESPVPPPPKRPLTESDESDDDAPPPPVPSHSQRGSQSSIGSIPGPPAHGQRGSQSSIGSIPGPPAHSLSAESLESDERGASPAPPPPEAGSSPSLSEADDSDSAGIGAASRPRRKSRHSRVGSQYIADDFKMSDVDVDDDEDSNLALPDDFDAESDSEYLDDIEPMSPSPFVAVPPPAAVSPEAHAAVLAVFEDNNNNNNDDDDDEGDDDDDEKDEHNDIVGDVVPKFKPKRPNRRSSHAREKTINDLSEDMFGGGGGGGAVELLTSSDEEEEDEPAPPIRRSLSAPRSHSMISKSPSPPKARLVSLDSDSQPRRISEMIGKRDLEAAKGRRILGLLAKEKAKVEAKKPERGWVNEEGFKSIRVSVTGFLELIPKLGRQFQVIAKVDYLTYKTSPIKVSKLDKGWTDAFEFPLTATTQTISVEVCDPEDPIKGFVGRADIPMSTLSRPMDRGWHHMTPVVLGKYSDLRSAASRRTEVNLEIRCSHHEPSRDIKHVQIRDKKSTSAVTDALRSVASGSTIRFRDEEFDLDLSYITDRIITMGPPATGKIEGLYKNRLSDVQRFLNTRHTDRYKIYNVAEEQHYEAAKFNDRVAHFPCESDGVMPFPVMVIFCKSVYQWLKHHPQNVVVVHGHTGEGITGTAVSSFLIYSKVSRDAARAVERFNRKRTTDNNGITSSSQLRYLFYWQRYCRGYIGRDADGNKIPDPLLKQTRSKDAPAFQLIRVTIHGIPSAIRGDVKTWFTLLQTHLPDFKYSSRKTIKPKRRDDNSIVWEIPPKDRVRLTEDIKVNFYYTATLRKRELMHCYINTRFVAENGRYAGKFEMVLPKDEIEVANKDADGKHFAKRMRLELDFQPAT